MQAAHTYCTSSTYRGILGNGVYIKTMCTYSVCGRACMQLRYSILSHHSGFLSVPKLTVSTASATVEFQAERSDSATDRVITGYEVILFGVPMIGVYLDANKRLITLRPAVPDAQYKITAWALNNNGRRSEFPAVEYATIPQIRELKTNIII